MSKPTVERLSDAEFVFIEKSIRAGRNTHEQEVRLIDSHRAISIANAKLRTAYDAQCAELAAMRVERDEARDRLEAIRQDIELPVVEATSEFGPENLEELIACVSKQGKGGNYCLDPDEIVAGRDELRSMCNALRLAWQQRDAARAALNGALTAAANATAERDAARAEVEGARRKAIEECENIVETTAPIDVQRGLFKPGERPDLLTPMSCNAMAAQAAFFAERFAALLTKPAGEGEV